MASPAIRGLVALTVLALSCTSEDEQGGSGGQGGAGGSGAGGEAATASGGNSGSASGGTSGSSGASGSGGVSGSSGGSGGAGAAGGSGGTAGSPDGSAGDAGDPCEGRIICDDFEGVSSGTPPASPWKLRESKGSVLVDDTRAFSGTRSVRVSVDATTSSDTYRRAFLTIDDAPLIPLPDNSVYGRFMIYIERIPDSSVHWTIAHGDGPLGSESATYNYGGMGDLMANYYRNTDPVVTDCWQTKDQDFPTGAWTCVAFQFDGQNDEMRFWLDGTEISELHVVGGSKTDATCTEKGIDGRWLAPDFDNISIGWEAYQHDSVGAQEAWIDDVILDDAPIACP
jgi:hypothetical protein